MIRRSGKKDYTLAVGKLNPAKLANFADIDLFVCMSPRESERECVCVCSALADIGGLYAAVVACPLNSIIDSKEFFKPIVTPFELELALAPYERLVLCLTALNLYHLSDVHRACVEARSGRASTPLTFAKCLLDYRYVALQWLCWIGTLVAHLMHNPVRA
jgi:hypothetical protein